MRFAPATGTAQTAEPTKTSDSSAGERLDDIERRHVLQALKDADGKVDTAAQRLGIPRSSLYAKLKRYGVASR
jgi:transcriptional regulator of acetoin/glycerol metabolism